MKYKCSKSSNIIQVDLWTHNQSTWPVAYCWLAIQILVGSWAHVCSVILPNSTHYLHPVSNYVILLSYQTHLNMNAAQIYQFQLWTKIHIFVHKLTPYWPNFKHSSEGNHYPSTTPNGFCAPCAGTTWWRCYWPSKGIGEKQLAVGEDINKN